MRLKLCTFPACLAMAWALAACGNQQLAEDTVHHSTQPSSPSAPTSAAPPTETPPNEDVVVVEGTYGVGARTLEELVDFGTVFFGTVTAEADGPDASVTDPVVHDRETRRLVTIRVDRVLTGDERLTEITTRTMGWMVDDEGRRTPMVTQGKPWLQVGDRVLYAAAEEPNTELHYTAGADGVFVLRDGVLQAPQNGHISPILELLRGKSMDEIDEALTAAE